MNDWNAYQEDREFVLSNLRDGNLDHIEVVSRVVETQFFQKFIGDGDLGKLAATYPTPRQKQEVPLWIYLATQLTLKLHGASGFGSLPYILHCGGLRDALEEGQVERKRDADSDQSFLSFTTGSIGVTSWWRRGGESRVTGGLLASTGRPWRRSSSEASGSFC